MYYATKDKVIQSSGTYDECWTYILKNQSQSVDWAMKYGSWNIEEAKVSKHQVLR